MTNILEPRLVGDLTLPKNNYQFFIPSYQRGYRWGKEEVRALLNDLLEFLNSNQSKLERYCLQPIVVKQLADGKYEVLDGQQRLTTLFILLSYLKQDYKEINLFGLTYETRPNSGTFLQNLSLEINNENPDYFYISQAYTIISEWFMTMSNDYSGLKMNLFQVIVNQVDIIWYEIKDAINPIDVFTRINIGKIPLTNSELVKAVFLSKNNLQMGLNESDKKIAETVLNNKQGVIALEWDAMEKQLQNHEFWSFIYNREQNNYETRIDYILDLITESPINKKDSLDSFNVYYNKVRLLRNNPQAIEELKRRNVSFIEEEWLELKSYFDILLEWYTDKWYNHIIGFLISRNENVMALLKNYKNLNRAGFKKQLLDRISELLLTKNIAELTYESNDKKTIEGILLLHNVIGSLLQPDTSVQFPFDKINTNRWSLEHIYAQHSEDLKEKDYPLWIADHLAYFRKESDSKNQEVLNIINALESLEIDADKWRVEEYKTAFLKIFTDIDKYLSKDSEKLELMDNDDENDKHNWVTDDHSIANLTLLDVGMNSHLSSSIFAVKREKIKEFDKAMAYIPNETRKVFLKYYSNSLGHDAYWTIEDRKAYVRDVESKINNLYNLLALK